MPRCASSRQRAPATTHIDPEGEAVWLQAYASERARGVRDQDARAKILAAIRAQ